MTEQTILLELRKQIDKLQPALDNGMSYKEFIDEIVFNLAREAIRKARREALRGN